MSSHPTKVRIPADVQVDWPAMVKACTTGLIPATNAQVLRRARDLILSGEACCGVSALKQATEGE